MLKSLMIEISATAYEVNYVSQLFPTGYKDLQRVVRSFFVHVLMMVADDIEMSTIFS